MSDEHPADDAAEQAIQEHEDVVGVPTPDFRRGIEEMQERWKDQHPDADEEDESLEPGIYDVSPGGVCTALVTESGGGDRELFYEILEDRGIHVEVDDGE